MQASMDQDIEKRDDPFGEEGRPKARPIPDVVPRFPSNLNFKRNEFVETFENDNERVIENFVTYEQNRLAVNACPYYVTFSPSRSQSLRGAFHQGSHFFRMPYDFPPRYPRVRNPEFYRSKPGSVYGIPPSQERKNYELFFQPKRYFTEYQEMRPKNKDTVHIGGLLTLPKNVSSSEESSQSSSSSNSSIEEAFTRPDMEDFKNLAYSGCKDVENLMVKYNVKSSRVDLEEFCKEVKRNLNRSHGLIQMEPVMREIILAFLHISSSWASVASLISEDPKCQNPLERTLSPLSEIFPEWQKVTKKMLEKIGNVLKEIPSEHERYLSNVYGKPNQEEIAKKVAETWPTPDECHNNSFKRTTRQRQNEESPWNSCDCESPFCDRNISILRELENTLDSINVYSQYASLQPQNSKDDSLSRNPLYRM